MLLIRRCYQLSIKSSSISYQLVVWVINQLLISQPSYQSIIDGGELSLIVDKIWNLTNEVHLTLTKWKPIPRIYPMSTTLSRSAEVASLGCVASLRTRKLGGKCRPDINGVCTRFFFYPFVIKHVREFIQERQTWERECGRV